ncbi:MAG: hypothetical protein ACYTEZ_11265 [Planctomycetota bacterium]
MPKTSDLPRVPTPRVDPREHQDWFRRLPPHAQEEMRERWLRQAEREIHMEQRRQTTYLRYVLEAGVAFALAEIVMAPAAGIAVATVLGCIVGVVAAHFRASTYSYAWIGLMGYLLYFLLTPWGNIFSFIFLVGVCGALGAIHYLQRHDGSEA